MTTEFAEEIVGTSDEETIYISVDAAGQIVIEPGFTYEPTVVDLIRAKRLLESLRRAIAFVETLTVKP
jgi:hypothetical protein